MVSSQQASSAVHTVQPSYEALPLPLLHYKLWFGVGFGLLLLLQALHVTLLHFPLLHQLLWTRQPRARRHARIGPVKGKLLRRNQRIASSARPRRGRQCRRTGTRERCRRPRRPGQGGRGSRGRGGERDRRHAHARG